MQNSTIVSVSLNIYQYTNQAKTILSENKCNIILSNPQCITFSSDQTSLSLKTNSKIYQFRQEHFQTFIIQPSCLYQQKDKAVEEKIEKEEDQKQNIQQILPSQDNQIQDEKNLGEQLISIHKKISKGKQNSNEERNSNEENKENEQNSKDSSQQKQENPKGLQIKVNEQKFQKQDIEENQEKPIEQVPEAKAEKQQLNLPENNQKNNNSKKEQISSIYTISIKKTEKIDDILFQTFIDTLETYLQVKDFKIGDSENPIYFAIIKHCPIQKQLQLGKNIQVKFGSASKVVGTAFAAISSFFQSRPQQKTESHNKIQAQIPKKQQESQNKDNAPSSWQLLKKKCWNINNSVTESFKPISEKAKQFGSQVGTKFDSSENQVIKKIRKWSKQTEQSLNEITLTQERRSSISFKKQDEISEELKQQSSQK